MMTEPQATEAKVDTKSERQDLINEILLGLADNSRRIGMVVGPTGPLTKDMNKDEIRKLHSVQKQDLAAREYRALGDSVAQLVNNFADGKEVVPAKIDPVLVPVNAYDDTGLLFRLATLLWSVPPSRGFGRRMRFLVKDRFNGRLIGIFALGDPVFNLRARDQWVGWTGEDRRLRLANVMDAYVVGAVPPYSQLLGGKLIVSSIGSSEVEDFYIAKYGGRRGIISHQVKIGKLAMVTITSALGRSSLYNRVRLPGLVELTRVGETDGWGHFHVPNGVFSKMRRLLEIDGHKYASGNEYGDGCNWRIRVAKAALERVGMNGDYLRHGVNREAYVMPIASNCRAFLRGEEADCDTARLPALADIAEAAKTRWVVPRSQRRPEYVDFRRSDILALLQQQFASGEAKHSAPPKRPPLVDPSNH